MKGVAWALFGNDEDGVYGERSKVPTFGPDAPRTQWQRVRWWLRNPFHNLFWHVLNWPGGPFFKWGAPYVGSGWNGYIGFRPPNGVFGIAIRKETKR